MNLMPAEILNSDTIKIYGQSVGLRGSNAPAAKDSLALVRPEQLSLAKASTQGPASATVFNLTFLGPLTRISVRMNSDARTLFVSMPSAAALEFVAGSLVDVQIHATSVLLDS